MRRGLYDQDHEAFREVVQAYVKREVTPNQQRWEDERNVGRQAWLAAGKQAIIGLRVPEEFGGAGTDDFRYRCVVSEELARVGATSLSSGSACRTTSPSRTSPTWAPRSRRPGGCRRWRAAKPSARSR